MKRPKRYTGTFRYAGRDITFAFWVCAEKAEMTPDIVLFLGAGQVGSIPRWVAQSAGSNVVVVEGLPHWETHSDVKDITQFGVRYVQAAFQEVRKTFGISAMHVIAESQAAPAGVILTHTQPRNVHNLLLIRPLGFTVQAYGDSEHARFRVFRRRIIRSYMQLPQTFLHDPRNVGVIVIMLRAMLREPNLAVLAQKYAAGISYDLLEDCRQTAHVQNRKGNTFTILLSERDKLFPPSEVRSTLEAANITGVDIDIMPMTTHSSLAVRSSKPVLRRALAIVRGQHEASTSS